MLMLFAISGGFFLTNLHRKISCLSEKNKFPQALLSYINDSYAVIIHFKLERQCLKQNKEEKIQFYIFFSQPRCEFKERYKLCTADKNNIFEELETPIKYGVLFFTTRSQISITINRRNLEKLR